METDKLKNISKESTLNHTKDNSNINMDASFETLKSHQKTMRYGQRFETIINELHANTQAKSNKEINNFIKKSMNESNYNDTSTNKVYLIKQYKDASMNHNQFSTKTNSKKIYLNEKSKPL